MHRRQLRAALLDYELLEAASLFEAEQLMHNYEIDMVIVEIHFDDSRATELVNYIRRNGDLFEMPIIVMRLSPSILASEIGQLISFMKSKANIADYIEFEADTLVP